MTNKLVNEMTFYNILWHLKMLSLLNWNLDISGFTYLSEFVQELEFTASWCHLYHLLSPVFASVPLSHPPSHCLCLNHRSPLPLSAHMLRTLMSEWCAFHELIGPPLKPHSYVQVHCYCTYFSWLTTQRKNNAFRLHCFWVAPCKLPCY